MNTNIESYKDFEDKRVVLLQSGGLDSNVCAAILSKLGFEIHHLFVDYGQVMAERELFFAREISNKYGGTLHTASLKVDWLSDGLLSKGGASGWEIDGNLSNVNEGTYVPLRNMFLLSLAGSLAEELQISHICAAFDGYEDVDGNPLSSSPDTHPTFVKKIESALYEGSAMFHVYGLKFDLLTPLMGLFKQDTIKLGQEYGADFSISWSCYNKGDKPCLKCSACKGRARGFFYAGIKDPLLEKFGLKVPMNKLFDLSY